MCCPSERGRNPNKSNVQRVDSALRARGSFRAGRFAVYRARPVTSGSSEAGANAGSEVGRARQFLERRNNGHFLSATERDRGRPEVLVSGDVRAGQRTSPSRGTSRSGSISSTHSLDTIFIF